MTNPPLLQFDHVGDVATATSEVTLRDLFAGAALAGMLANQTAASGLHPSEVTPETFARTAFALADALLDRRSKS